MLILSNQLSLADWEIDLSAIRAQGAGGQNVNKVSTAIHLRFDIQRSSLPHFYKQRLLQYPDSRITKDGIIIIKAQSHRSQEKNRKQALQRLQQLIIDAVKPRKKRIATKPSKAAKRRRIVSKKQHSEKKSLRNKLDY